ncbi:60S ribosomal protein L34 [Tanacetum coccineum]
MEMIDEELHPKKPVRHVDLDSDVETNHPLDDAAHVVEQFEHEDEGNVNIPKMTTYDPWLNKLVEDPDDEQVESKFKAKKNVSYPSFNLNIPWNECKLMLKMRFKSPQQLKHTLANYYVQHGYQLWYMQQDHNRLLVFCGRDINEGKCVGLKGKKTKTNDNEGCETSKQGSKKGDGRKAVNEIISKAVRKDEIKRRNMRKKGLVEYYSKLWQYGQAILDTNPDSACELETEVNDEDGKLYFRRFYFCFYGVKHGWHEGCRKIISLDGCFLTHTCKRQLLTVMDRDANNQMFPIAWVVVGVENIQNWCWFLSLIRDNLNLGDG